MKKFIVEIKISGIYSEEIEAIDREEANAKAQQVIKDHEFCDDILRNVKEEIVLIHSLPKLKC